MNEGGEISRIKAEYGRRDSDSRLANLYERLNPAVIYIRHEIERHIALFFNRKNIRAADLNSACLLDIGSGGGAFFNMFSQMGFAPFNMYGAELIFERLSSRGPGPQPGRIINADASRLPFRDSSFDFVSQFTVFSSVIDPRARAEIASEMRRVAKNGGYVISYDMVHTNPFNKNLAPLKPRQLKELFGAPPETSYSVVLNPLVLRRLVNHFRLLCDVISSFKILNSFNLSFIRVEK